MKRLDVTRRGLLMGGAGLWLWACGSSRRNTGPADGAKTSDAALTSEGYLRGYEPALASDLQNGTGRQPTAACGDETEDNILGPFYRSGAPERTSAFAGASTPGRRLVLSGRVMDTACRPLAGAVLDLWHADDHGEYDHDGFRLRGRLTCDAAGAYRLETIVPGHYLNGPQYRPAHIHVKVHAGGRELLTTQLYFAGDPYNGDDAFIRPSLIVPIQDSGGGKSGVFDFVVRAV